MTNLACLFENDAIKLSQIVFAGLTLYISLLFYCFRLFSAGSVEEIMENLKKDGSAFALKQTEVNLGMVAKKKLVHPKVKNIKSTSSRGI